MKRGGSLRDHLSRGRCTICQSSLVKQSKAKHCSMRQMKAKGKEEGDESEERNM
jgi:hypothetical protein